MADIQLKPSVIKWMKSLPPKHRGQIKHYLLNLASHPMPQDAKPIKNYAPYRRGDVGEYRVIYRYDKRHDSVTIVLIGKRNDNDIYKRMKRLL